MLEHMVRFTIDEGKLGEFEGIVQTMIAGTQKIGCARLRFLFE